MKKTIIILVLLAQFAIAQTSNKYTFSRVSGTYTPLTTKTIFQSGAQLNTDAISSEITLPFAFTLYGGVPQTKVFLVNNGFITFGTAPSRATIFSPLSSSEVQSDYVISGLGNQIIASQIGNPEISYGQNQTGDMVFQFQDISFQTAPLVRMTFQIVLKSDGTTVEIVFGANCTGQAITSTRGSQIGLRDKQVFSNGSIYGMTTIYNNLSLSNGDWNKVVPRGQSGGVSLGQNTGSSVTTRLATGLNMVMPISGNTYKFN